MTASTTAGGTGPVQGRLWSTRARDWAEAQEATVLPLFEAIADRLGVGAGNRLLDVGCGAGRFLRLAADRGADVAGLDAAPAPSPGSEPLEAVQDPLEQGEVRTASVAGRWMDHH